MRRIFAGMKKLILIFVMLVSVAPLFAQDEEIEMPPYLKDPMLPAFEMLMLDSTTMLQTADIPAGQPIVIMYFSPDCSHCVTHTEEMIKHWDIFSDANIYMITPMTLSATKEFSEKMELDKKDNVTFGKDVQFFVMNHYDVKSFPFTAVYDKDKKLVGGFDSKADLETIIRAVSLAK